MRPITFGAPPVRNAVSLLVDDAVNENAHLNGARTRAEIEFRGQLCPVADLAQQRWSVHGGEAVLSGQAERCPTGKEHRVEGVQVNHATGRSARPSFPQNSVRVLRGSYLTEAEFAAVGTPVA
ncbi:MAG: hypothetical protein AMXMBFR34_10050 [Myxococcaceae bacterium]